MPRMPCSSPLRRHCRCWQRAAAYLMLSGYWICANPSLNKRQWPNGLTVMLWGCREIPCACCHQVLTAAVLDGFSLLQAGESCVGKTTLIKNLFAAYCREADPAIQDGACTVQQFVDVPEAGCTDIEVQVQPEGCESITSFHYCIQASLSGILQDSCTDHFASAGPCIGTLIQAVPAVGRYILYPVFCR